MIVFMFDWISQLLGQVQVSITYQLNGFLISYWNICLIATFNKYNISICSCLYYFTLKLYQNYCLLTGWIHDILSVKKLHWYLNISAIRTCTGIYNLSINRYLIIYWNICLIATFSKYNITIFSFFILFYFKLYQNYCLLAGCDPFGIINQL